MYFLNFANSTLQNKVFRTIYLHIQNKNVFYNI